MFGKKSTKKIILKKNTIFFSKMFFDATTTSHYDKRHSDDINFRCEKWCRQSGVCGSGWYWSRHIHDDSANGTMFGYRTRRPDTDPERYQGNGKRPPPFLLAIANKKGGGRF